MTRATRAITLLFGAAFLAASGPLWSGPPFELQKSVVGAGGNRAAAGSFVLDSSTGQPVAGRMESGAFVLQAGFWAADTPQVSDLIFKDGYE